MELDNKILKYKLKKKKLTNKINELIEKKKKEKHDLNTKIFQKTHEFYEIINKIIIGDLKNNIKDINNNNNLYIIISGFVSVGKSTFIEYLEKFFGESYTKCKINIKDEGELNIFDNLINNHEKKIVYIETNHIFIEEIHKKIINEQKRILNNNEFDDEGIFYKNIYTFNLVPINLKVYKNRFINKLYKLLNLSLSYSNVLNIDKNINSHINKILLDILHVNISKDVILEDNILEDFPKKLSNKFPLTDDDFSFLDSYIEKSYNLISEYQHNYKNIKKIMF
jgi:hypothetical protein